MARKCSVCQHPEVDKINRCIASGESHRSIARRFGFSSSTVDRHVNNCLSKQLLAAEEAKVQAGEATHGERLLQRAEAYEGKAWHLMKKAEKDGDIRAAIAALRETRECMKTLAQLLGELKTGDTYNIVQSPVFIQIKVMMMQELAPYPEAARALQQGLERIANDAGGAG